MTLLLRSRLLHTPHYTRALTPFSNVSRRTIATSADKSPIGIVMLNLGGPKTQEDVQPFLQRLFSDPEIMKLPFQRFAAEFIARRRSPEVRKNYARIGGGSPILKWTEIQGKSLVNKLQEMNPEAGPFKHYIAFRYAAPFSEDALLQMKADGVKRAIAFTQYPHWSCSTTGSSLNNLWRSVEKLGLQKEFQWSIIDRWAYNPGLISAVAKKVKEGMAKFQGNDKDVIIVFSAHSLPMKVVARGDSYPGEISAMTHLVMEKLGYSHNFLLAWQSKVGPLPWLSPSTENVIRMLAKQGHKGGVLIVPVAFTSDHIETLSEIDIDLKEVAHKVGLPNLHRAPSLNDDPEIINTMADVVSQHLKSGAVVDNRQYWLRCPGCITVDGKCRTIVNPIEKVALPI